MGMYIMKTSKINPIIVLLILGSFSSFGCKEAPSGPTTSSVEPLDLRLLGTWQHSRCNEQGGQTTTLTLDKEKPGEGNGLQLTRECKGSQQIVEEIPFRWTQVNSETIFYSCRIDQNVTYRIDGNTLYWGHNSTPYIKLK